MKSIHGNVQRSRLLLGSELSSLPLPALTVRQPVDGEFDHELEFRRMHETLTRLRREVESLREKERQHRLLFEKSPNPRFVCDCRTLRLLAVNEAASRHYGFTRGELLGLTANDLCAPSDRAGFLAYCHRVSLKGSLPVEAASGQFRHFKKDGSLIHVEVTAAVIPYKGKDAFLVLAQDITHRKQTEQRLLAHHATTQALAESVTVAEASPKILRAICESLGCDRGELWRVNQDSSALRCAQVWAPASELELPTHRRTLARGEGIPGMVWLKNKPLWIKDIAQEPHLARGTPVGRGLRTALAFPIRLNDEVLGVIVVYTREVRGIDKHLLRMFQDITSQVGQVMGRRRVERQLLEVSEREQQRIGQDLHDGLCQQLAGVAYLADNLQARLAQKSPHDAAAAARIHTLLKETIVQARQLARGLNPVKLESVGLMAALQELTSSIESLFSISCRFECWHRVLLHNHETAIHLYRIAQEAIHNAITHGKATQIVVSLARKEDKLVLSVRDNGRGLSPSMPRGDGRGVENMRYRARTIGAQLQWDPRPVGGTVVSCTLLSQKERQP